MAPTAYPIEGHCDLTQHLPRPQHETSIFHKTFHEVDYWDVSILLSHEIVVVFIASRERPGLGFAANFDFVVSLTRSHSRIL